MNRLETGIEYRISEQNNFSLGLRELWLFRELFFFFTWRDIKVKYKQATLGILWVIIQPLALMAVFTMIFNKGLKVGSEGLPYPIFAFSGLLIWNIFSSGLLNSANSMVNSANIIRKIYFPRLIIPISAILTSIFDFCFAFVVFLGLLLFYHQPINFPLFLLYFPLSLLLTVITTLGLGILFAALNVKYRDFQYALPFFVQFLLFVNPVLYSNKAFKQSWISTLMKFNPVSAAINIERAALNNQTIAWNEAAFGFLSAIFIFFAGLYIFRKTEGYFGDLV